MNVKIKSFEMSYLADVLKCWNKNLVYDLINEERFTEIILLDDNFDPNLFKVAFVNNQCVGFAFGIKRKIPYLERGLEPTRGWINMIAVNQNYRHQKIGTTLIQSLEADLKKLGATEITLCAYSPNYFTPGIDLRYKAAIPFFESLNYSFNSEEVVSMQRDLWDFTMSETTKTKIADLNAQGISIVPYEKKYMLQLQNFLLSQFGAGWKRNALIAMQRHEAEKVILLVVNSEDKILGFCMRKIDGNEGRFGPFGVDESLRSHGIGGVLFETMMQDMKSRGIPYLYFLWTGGAAMRFYLRHGVKVYRTYKLSRKEI